MSLTPPPTVAALLAAYAALVAGLNVFCYLIATFYQQKFKEHSPRAGFLGAAIAGAVLAVTLGLFHEDSSTLTLLRVFLVSAGGVASAWNSVSLYYTMKRVRK